ncbi:MAG: PfkB family carbohydrate kinase [Treponema sp.]|nr:PfkB family carbohydrate kinase [Treponema sp.]
MILTVCLSSTLQKTVTFNKVSLTHVNRSTSYRLDASGKAVNTARVLDMLEPGVSLSLCPLGKENADLFLKLAEQDGLAVKTVMVPGFTRECLTLLDSSSHETTEIVVGEPALEFDRENTEKEFMEILQGILSGGTAPQAVVLAGSRPAIWSEDFQARISKAVVGAGVILLADFCGKDLLRTLEICTPQIIKINEEEFCSTFCYEFPVPEDKLRQLISEKSKELKNVIVITRGTDETYAACNGEFYSHPVEKVIPVNTTACGDTFNAGFIYEYLKSLNGTGNADIQGALSKGTWCAARNAESEVPGTIR